MDQSFVVVYVSYESPRNYSLHWYLVWLLFSSLNGFKIDAVTLKPELSIWLAVATLFRYYYSLPEHHDPRTGWRLTLPQGSCTWTNRLPIIERLTCDNWGQATSQSCLEQRDRGQKDCLEQRVTRMRKLRPNKGMSHAIKDHNRTGINPLQGLLLPLTAGEKTPTIKLIIWASHAILPNLFSWTIFCVMAFCYYLIYYPIYYVLDDIRVRCRCLYRYITIAPIQSIY